MEISICSTVRPKTFSDNQTIQRRMFSVDSA